MAAMQSKRKRKSSGETRGIHPRNKYSDNPPDFFLLTSLYPSFQPYVFYSREGSGTFLNSGEKIKLKRARFQLAPASRAWVKWSGQSATLAQSLGHPGSVTRPLWPCHSVSQLGHPSPTTLSLGQGPLVHPGFRSLDHQYGSLLKTELGLSDKVPGRQGTGKCLLSCQRTGIDRCLIRNSVQHYNQVILCYRNTACGGTSEEMVCFGGERAFICRIIGDSVQLKHKFRWFTSMVGRKSNLRILVAELWDNGVIVAKTTEFVQGKTSRWTCLVFSTCFKNNDIISGY